MQEPDLLYFKKLLEQIYSKTFQKPIDNLSRAEATLLSHQINVVTGSTLSDKTLLNYYKSYITENYDSVNPTLFTLDILVSYSNNKPFEHQNNEIGLRWYDYKKQRIKPKLFIDLIGNTNSKKRLVFYLTIILSTLSISLFILYRWNQPPNFRDNFNGLKNEFKLSHKWNIYFRDTTWLRKQLSNDHLTLYTLPGDFWVKNYEKPEVQNTILTKVEDKDFEINIKIDSFIPFELSQQVGIIFSDDDLNYSNHIRFNLDFSIVNNEILQCAEERIGVSLTHILSHNGIQYGYWKLNNIEDYTTFRSRINHIWLKLVYKKENQKLLAFAKVEKEFKDYFKVGQVEGLVSPRYVGISAFQGFTDDFGNPNNAEIVPVMIDYFELIYQ